MEVVLQDEQLVEVAFLGPKGTYGYQAAKQLIARLDATCSASSSPTSATPQATAPEAAHRYQYTPCPTIPDIYTCPAEYLVMPLQNTLHGGVLETLDSLLSPLTPAAQGKLRSRSKGGSDTGNGDPGKDGEETRGLGMPMIVDSLDLGIRHCLVVKRGTRMEDIRWVRSHEQALGQSSAFLSQHLPHATRQTWPSTAGAAASLLAGTAGDSDNDSNRSALAPDGTGATAPGHARIAAQNGASGDISAETTAEADAHAHAQGDEGAGAGAAICSKTAIEDMPELEVLYEGTQGIDDNYTRFLLLSRQPHHPSDTPSHASQRPSSATGNSSTHFYALSDPAHIGALAARGSIVTVHSRPAPPSVPVSPHAAAAKGASGGGADGGRYPVSVLLELRLNSHGSGDDSANASGEVNGTKSDSGSAARNGEEREWGLEWEREGVVYLGSAPA